MSNTALAQRNGTSPNTGLATTGIEADTMEAVIANGDLSKLTPAQRVQWYRMRCDAVGLDPRTKPFDYITLNNKLTLYATKTATEQLCEQRGLSCEIVREEFINGLYRVHARVKGVDGRHTENIGIVNADNLRGEALANAMMKAVTKAFRRAVLSHCGMGMLDETETETMPGAVVSVVSDPPEQQATEQQVRTGGLDEHGTAWCECGVMAKHVIGKSGAGWVCGNQPRICGFKMKDNTAKGDAVSAAIEQAEAVPAGSAGQAEIVEGEVASDNGAETIDHQYLQPVYDAIAARGWSCQGQQGEALVMSISSTLLDHDRDPIETLSDLPSDAVDLVLTGIENGAVSPD